MQFLDGFSKNTQMPNFMKIRPVGTEFFHADGQTDMTQLMHFSQFCERTYKQMDLCISPCTVFWIMKL